MSQDLPFFVFQSDFCIVIKLGFLYIILFFFKVFDNVLRVGLRNKMN